MPDVNNSVAIFEDSKVNIKIKLAGLWTALMFFYVYNDLITFFRKDLIEDVLSGVIGGMEINQAFLLASAVLMSISIVMIPLSLILSAKANRIANIVAGVFLIGILIMTFFVPGDQVWYHYTLYSVFEAIVLAAIIRLAIKWPKRPA